MKLQETSVLPIINMAQSGNPKGFCSLLPRNVELESSHEERVGEKTNTSCISNTTNFFNWWLTMCPPLHPPRIIKPFTKNCRTFDLFCYGLFEVLTPENQVWTSSQQWFHAPFPSASATTQEFKHKWERNSACLNISEHVFMKDKTCLPDQWGKHICFVSCRQLVHGRCH